MEVGFATGLAVGSPPGVGATVVSAGLFVLAAGVGFDVVDCTVGICVGLVVVRTVGATVGSGIAVGKLEGASVSLPSKSSPSMLCRTPFCAKRS